ncbi:hypothetical protein NQ176_g7512 [Zarea fungicola]|uniref:Uncharacterized protein n=1 Tax=Zarea fungicola TaxID=93591 RepID=A0ACC1N001_9HYPO|nr:hypothetical protein NQ176_g7512 [Lecanicillium fungicola]
MTAKHPWEYKNGRWEQDAGFMTRFYASITPAVGQPMHWMIASVVKFQYKGDSRNVGDVLRNAWLEMRHKFPVIASQVVGSKKVYEIANDHTLAAWLESSFRVKTGTVNDAFKTMTNVPYITLNYFPASNEIMIASPHTYADGRGLLYLVDAFFAAASNPGTFKFGDEHARLPPNEDTLLSLPEVITEGHYQKAGQTLGLLMQSDPIRMPVEDMTVPPGEVSREELKISAPLSGRIVAACKDRGYTVTSAWHTAVVLAVAKLQAAAGQVGKVYSSFSNYDLRSVFPSSFEPRHQPISCYHTGLPLAVTPEGKSFDAISSEIRSVYKTALSVETAASFPAVSKLAIDAFSAGLPPSSTPVLSSIGVLERFMGHSFGSEWEIEDFWMADCMLSAEVEMFLWAWKGQVVLSGSFNLAYYTNDQVAELLQNVKQELLNGLAISE